MKLPPILVGDRALAFARLVGNGALQVGLTVAIGLLATDLLAATPSRPASITGLLLLPLAGGVFLLRWLERVDAARMAQSYVYELRMSMFRRIWRTQSSGIARQAQGTMLLRLMGDMGAIGRWIGQGLARLAVTTAIVLGVTIALASIEPVVAGAAILLLLILIAAARVVQGPLDRAVRRARAARGRLANRATDSLMSLLAIQVSGTASRERRRIDSACREARTSTVHEVGWSASILAGSEVVAMLAPALAVVAVALLASDPASRATLPIVILLLGLLVAPMRDVMRVFELWRKARVAEEKLASIMQLPRLARARVTPAVTIDRAWSLELDQVVIEGLARPVDLRAARGDRILLSGVAGSGKTSLLMCCIRLIDPDSGTIRVNGHDLRDLDLTALRSRIALVSPALGMPRGSLRRLLTLRRPDATDEEIRDVIVRCHLEKALSRLPQGLQTRLANGGSNLPVSVRARVLLAQALLGDPDMLLIDDVDSTVPSSQITELQAILAGFGGTVVLVSSDPRWHAWAGGEWQIDAGLDGANVPVIRSRRQS
jgi:ATP-binding cassette, subfamily B, bacterial